MKRVSFNSEEWRSKRAVSFFPYVLLLLLLMLVALVLVKTNEESDRQTDWKQGKVPKPRHAR